MEVSGGVMEEVEEVTGHSMKPTGEGVGDDKGPNPTQCLPAVQKVLGDPGKGNDHSEQ